MEFYFSFTPGRRKQKSSGVSCSSECFLHQRIQQCRQPYSAAKMLRSKRKISYADCMSYALALEHGHKVLTGDEQFRNLEHVVFVEKLAVKRRGYHAIH